MDHSLSPPHALVGAVAIVGAVAALLVFGAGPSAAAPDCTLTADAPASYYGIAAITSGSVDCASRQNVLRFSIVLQRDGVTVATGERTCHKAATCWSYLIHDDAAGDQRWCSTVSARIGSQALPPVTACEDDPLL